MYHVIVTHVSPDWDAIASVWLLKRYGGMADADVVFVNTGNPDPAVLDAATAVVDTGRVFDAARRRFDHHQLPGAASNETCATEQVYEQLLEGSDPIDRSISPLIDLIYQGDTGKPEAHESRTVGIHALLSAAKATKRFDDHGLLAFGFDILDLLADSLTARAIARSTLAQHTVYTSADGLVVALRDAPQGATFAAYDKGARLVVFANYEKNAIGVMRGGEGAEVSCLALVNGINADHDCGLAGCSQAVHEELCTWYRHTAGFFAGRGTDKAPSDTPILVDLVDVAKAIDSAWHR